MAQRVNIVLVDDLDESEASETIQFGLDGTNYEIDLNDKHASALRRELSKYVENARRVGKAASGGRKKGPSAAEMRDWARANGHEVPDRGRVPAEIKDAYVAAH